MTLRDHFHPPLSERRHWHSFHNGWAYNLAANLNQTLPKGYFAEANVQFGIEIDTAVFDENPTLPNTISWQPPAPTLTIPFAISTDVVEVQVYNYATGPTLVGAIEIISPANKDRHTHRRAFISKCETLLRQRIGLVIVDVVTNRTANLHDALLTALGSKTRPWQTALYATAYRPTEQHEDITLDIWQHPLSIGQALPSHIPLWLRDGPCLPIDLHSTYQHTAIAHRLNEIEQYPSQ